MTSRFITPRLSSTGDKQASLVLPASPDMAAIVRSLLVSLCDTRAWEQIQGNTISVYDAVALAEQILQSYEDTLQDA